MPRYLIDFTPLRRLRAHGRTSYYLRLWAAVRRCQPWPGAGPAPDLLARVWRQVASEAQGVYADRPGPPLLPRAGTARPPGLR